MFVSLQEMYSLLSLASAEGVWLDRDVVQQILGVDKRTVAPNKVNGRFEGPEELTNAGGGVFRKIN